MSSARPLVSIALAMWVAAALAGVGCKKRKPAPAREAEIFAPSAGEAPAEPSGRHGPKRSTNPVSVGVPPREPAPAADDPPPAVADPAAAEAPIEPAPGAGGAAGTAVTAPSGMIPGSKAKEAAATAPPELVERGDVAIGDPDVGAGRDAEDVAALLRRVRTPIASCHTRAIRDNPELAGTMTFDLTIDPRGVVSSFTVDGSLDSALSECVANRLRGLRFGAAERETRIRVPIRFGRQ